MTLQQLTSITLLGSLMGCSSLGPFPRALTAAPTPPAALVPDPDRRLAASPERSGRARVPVPGVQTGAQAPVPGASVADAAPGAGQGEQGPIIVAVAPNVFELRFPLPAAAREPEALAAQPPRTVLAIANGVGITRLARSTARRLAEAGISTARLSNARPYRQARTRIEYLPGQQAAVQALADRLPVPVERVPVAVLPASVQVRLVLGHDLAGRSIAAWTQETRGRQRMGSVSLPACLGQPRGLACVANSPHS